jgi:hypothetical protein
MKKRGFVIGVASLTAATSAIAQVPPADWGGPRYGPPPYNYPEPSGMRDPREGKVEVQTFVSNSPAAQNLGHGAIVLGAQSGAPEAGVVSGLFEAAIADQLTHAGYQPNAPGMGQRIDYVVTQEVIEPPEPPHSPVQGDVGVGVGSYGSGMGLGLAIDLSKPLGALIATRVEARITDSATHELLWQGHAKVLARENDKHWRPEITATRLAAALFKEFPRPISH